MVTLYGEEETFGAVFPDASEILGNLTEDYCPKVYLYDVATGFCFHEYLQKVGCCYPGCNKLTYLPPYCIRHNNHHGVEVLNSDRVKDQLGLYATRKFELGDEICLYGVAGVNNYCLLTEEWKNYSQTIYGSCSPIYSFVDSEYDVAYDCALIRYPGAYANDAEADNTEYQLEGIRNNACFQTDENSSWLEATGTINPGEEIFVDYGPDFWRSSAITTTYFTTSRDLVPSWYEEAFKEYYLQQIFQQSCQI